MRAKRQVINNRRRYNQWVANETLEDFALRYTANRARKWSSVRITNTALGIVSFLALEAIGGTITIKYGFENSAWAILVVCTLIFLSGFPICYFAARKGLDIDLLTRGAGFGYVGSTISSLVYASFTFIFFALEAAIMSMALQLMLNIPLAIAYVISALVVIPLVTHGITRISRFQLWTQPFWIILQIAPLVFILYHYTDSLTTWTEFTGLKQHGHKGFDLTLFGAAAAVIFPLIAQNGEQVDFLRFLPDKEKNSKRWWLSLTLAGPGWSIFGVLKLFAGSFLAVLAINHGIDPNLADDPAHMYLVAFSYITQNPNIAVVLVGAFVIISQLKINVTNAYAGSLAWSNFFSRLTHEHPGRIVWLIFNVSIALLLMELGLYQVFENILITYSALVLAWIGSLVADLVINRPLGLRPKEIEFKRGYLYDINPVGVGSMFIASALGILGQMDLFGPTIKAVSPFISLFTPFVTAPIIAWWTKGKYYIVRTDEKCDSTDNAQMKCSVCENSFDHADMGSCPAYGGHICSLCCALDSSCQDQCRPKAHLKAQTYNFLRTLLPKHFVDALSSVVGHFVAILFITGAFVAVLLVFVFLSVNNDSMEAASLVKNALWQTYFLLLIVTGVLIWLYVLAENSRRKALEESLVQNDLLVDEIQAHEQTYSKLQIAKEAAVAANQAKSRYLSGVSHELRTPLNTIFGYAQLLENDKTLPERSHKPANAIRRNSEHLADVIEGLLEISKIEARRLDLHRDQVKIMTVIEQLVDMFSAQASAKNLAFEYECKPEFPTYVVCDEKRLRQILMNLLSNAIKFTSQGKISFQVSYRNEVARFIVSDTGVGIKPEDQERIFYPFERVRDKATEFVTGTGLGLAISRLLSNIVGGDISLSSEPGKGSRFEFVVMLPTIREQHKNLQMPEEKISGYSGDRKTILVVDDEALHRELIVDVLSPLGFNVLQAHNSQSAMRLSDNEKIDLYLLDVFMPGDDGWELAEKLRQSNITVPIIMLSANAIEDQRSEMTSRLHDDYLIKPIRLQVLLEKIGFALGLNWNYGKSSNLSDSLLMPKVFAPGEVNLPPQSELDELVAMAKIGYLSGVMQKLDQLKEYDKDSSFIAYLKSQAELCDFEGLIQTIKGMGIQ